MKWEHQIKDCPFCGKDGCLGVYENCEHEINIDNKKYLHSITTNFGWIVMCNMCCNSTMLWDTKQQAIKAWNKRINPSPEKKQHK